MEGQGTEGKGKQRKVYGWERVGKGRMGEGK